MSGAGGIPAPREVRAEVVADGFAFLEGPRWHEGRLWVSDMHGHAIYAVDEKGSLGAMAEIPGRPSGLGWLPDGRLLVISMTDRTVLRLEPEGLAVHADLSAFTEHDLNDMWVDSDGRAYVGEMGLDIEAFLAEHAQELAERGLDVLAGLDVPPARLFRVDPDGSVTQVATDLRFPNGTTISPDGRRLVVAETLGLRLSTFDLADGHLASRRTTPLEFLPDGISVTDADGCVWVASPYGNSAERIAPDGHVVERVRSDHMVVACALGGRSGRTLFLCTATALDAATAASVRQSRLEAAAVSIPAVHRAVYS